MVLTLVITLYSVRAVSLDDFTFRSGNKELLAFAPLTCRVRRARQRARTSAGAIPICTCGAAQREGEGAAQRTCTLRNWSSRFLDEESGSSGIRW